METLYRQIGYSFSTKFFHVAEKLSPMKGEGAAGRVRAAYHDPCYLGRYRKVYDAPREWIKSLTGKEPIEFYRRREKSYCSGAGGLLPVSSPKTADAITKNRLQEFRDTKADALVTACPTCARRFKKIDRKLTVLTLSDLAGEFSS
jgi:Fe-S oxidoreductase